MSFTAPRDIPGIDAEARRALLAALSSIQNDLQALSEATSVTPMQVTDFNAAIGDIALVTPPAASMKAVLPEGNSTNQGQRIAIAVISVASTGTVIVSVAGGAQKVDGALTKTLSTVGIVEFVSLGAVGWESIGIGTASGGSSGVSFALARRMLLYRAGF